jgi:hypothetical protein
MYLGVWTMVILASDFGALFLASTYLFTASFTLTQKARTTGTSITGFEYDFSIPISHQKAINAGVSTDVYDGSCRSRFSHVFPMLPSSKANLGVKNNVYNECQNHAGYRWCAGVLMLKLSACRSREIGGQCTVYTSVMSEQAAVRRKCAK